MSEEAHSEINSDMIAFLDSKLLPLGDRLELLEANGEVAPGIPVVGAAGHQSGHMMVEIASAGETLLYVSDAVLHPLSLEHAHWCAVYDRSPEQGLALKRALLERAAAEGLMIHAFHSTSPGWGTSHATERRGGGTLSRAETRVPSRASLVSGTGRRNDSGCSCGTGCRASLGLSYPTPTTQQLAGWRASFRTQRPYGWFCSASCPSWPGQFQEKSLRADGR